MESRTLKKVKDRNINMDVITINTDCQEEYERKVRSFLQYGYGLKSCSCGYYGIASDTCFPYWMAILVK